MPAPSLTATGKTAVELGRQLALVVCEPEDNGVDRHRRRAERRADDDVVRLKPI
jgi:hypothetical protein